MLARFNGQFNMAEDARLLTEAERGSVGWRVYGWDGPWVSLGHYQDPERDLLDPGRVPWVMRPTGGKAVLHGHDVTVGLAAPLAALAEWGEPSEAEKLARSLKAVYRRAIAPILEAMNACGVPAVLGEEFKKPPRPLPEDSEKGAGKTSDCFAVVSPNDVVDARTGLKVCGCALKLTQTAVLVQASLPAGTPLIDSRLVFARPAVLAAPAWNSDDFPIAFEHAMQIRAPIANAQP